MRKILILLILFLVGCDSTSVDNDEDGKVNVEVSNYQVYEEMTIEYLKFDVKITNNTDDTEYAYHDFTLFSPNGESIDDVYNTESCSSKLVNKDLRPDGNTSCVASFKLDGYGEYELEISSGLFGDKHVIVLDIQEDGVTKKRVD